MIGTTLGPYRIDAELGSGGMGKVYRAMTTRKAAGLDPDTTVALKIVHPHLTDTEGFFKRFLREGEIGKAVRHENVVRTFDCDALSGQMYLVMEYVEGQTLRDLLAELERVPEELCRHIGREVAKGLAAIHAAGVIHRDMKPENVLITGEHVVKVMDLGVARLNDEALRLSQTGAFVGSIHYAAPECFSEGGKRVDGRVDLHALGLVLYELACGQNPYYAESVPEILKKVLHEKPRRLGDVNPQLSPFFEEVVHALLAKEPADRFADAGALLAVLDEGESGSWWRQRAKALRDVTHQPLRRIRIPRETAVYGREEEIATLRAAYERVKTGEGQVVLIAGEAGIGKSRVVDELIGRLQREGEELNFLFGSYPPGGAATAAGAFSTAFREHFGADGSAAYLAQTPLLVPAFDALLSGDATPAGVEPLTKDSLQTCFIHATRGLAAERTTVLVIDDLHFATDDARALFASLASAVPGHRVLLVGTTRPGIDEKWVAGLTRLPQTRQMSLHRLGPKDLGALLKDTLKSEQLAQSLAFQIGLKSDGNPFFVFEIIRGLRDGQFLTQQHDGSWVTTRVIDDIKVPSSILDLVNARVADLSEDERNLLDVAACWGFEFDPMLVGDALGVPQIPLMRALAQIEKKHRLVRSAGRRFVFDHHQVQEALYDAMPELLREPYHAALASALETRTKAADKDPASLDGALCVDLCEQFLKGAQGERALRYLAAASTHLEAGYLNEAAIRLSERALAVPGLLTGTERATVLIRLARVLDVAGRKSRQAECAQEAESLAAAGGDACLRMRAATSLAWCLHQAGARAEAESACRRAVELARVVGTREELARATSLLGLTFQAANRFEDAQTLLEQAGALYRELGDRAGEARVSVNQGNGCFDRVRLEEATAFYERGIALFQETGARRGEANATMNLGLIYIMQGRTKEAAERIERALATYRVIGDRNGEATSMGNLGVNLAAQGRLLEAGEHHARAIAMHRETGNRYLEAMETGRFGGVLAEQGRLTEARACVERRVAMALERGDHREESWALHGLADVLRELGERAVCETALHRCLAICEETDDRRLKASAQYALGCLSAESGDVDRAREWLATARDESRAAGIPSGALFARCELALLPGGDRADALAAFTEHGARVDGGERIAARLLLWKATGDVPHLAEAKRLLDEAVAHVPADIRESMLTNLRVNREIMAAAKAAGL